MSSPDSEVLLQTMAINKSKLDYFKNTGREKKNNAKCSYSALDVQYVGQSYMLKSFISAQLFRNRYLKFHEELSSKGEEEREV